MGRYFVQFHNVLNPHISVRNGNITNVYNDIFSWTIPANEQITDRPDGNEEYYSSQQITHWTTGKDELLVSILVQASNNPDMAVETYAATFYNLLYDKLKLSGQSIEMLDSDMKRFLSIFPITFFDIEGEPEKDRRYYPASYALVTALIYDRVHKDAKSGKDRLIDPELYMALSDTFSTCKKNNIRFASPFILDILFMDEFSILHFALELVADGLGRKWKQKVQEYVKGTSHKSFIKENFGEHELIFLAKILAIKENHTNKNRSGYQSGVANFETICRVFPFCRKSRTITGLWAEITDHGVDQALWDKIVEYSHRQFGVSTAPPILLITEVVRKKVMVELQRKRIKS